MKGVVWLQVRPLAHKESSPHVLSLPSVSSSRMVRRRQWKAVMGHSVRLPVYHYGPFNTLNPLHSHSLPLRHTTPTQSLLHVLDLESLQKCMCIHICVTQVHGTGHSQKKLKTL